MKPHEIYDLRTDIGVSQPALAHFLGVSTATIVRWEDEDDARQYTAKGLQLVLLYALLSLAERESAPAAGDVVRTAQRDHTRALTALFTGAARR